MKWTIDKPRYRVLIALYDTMFNASNELKYMSKKQMRAVRDVLRRLINPIVFDDEESSTITRTLVEAGLKPIVDLTGIAELYNSEEEEIE